MKLTRIAVVVLVALGLVGCGQPGAPAIRVGALFPYTGSSAAAAWDLERGALMAAAAVSPKTGLVDIDFRNTKSEPEEAVKLATELSAGTLPLIFGPGGDDGAGEAFRQLSLNGVVLASPTSSSEGVAGSSKANPWFRLSPATKAMGDALAKEMLRRGKRKIGIVRGRDVYHADFIASFVPRFTQQGQVAFDETVDTAMTAAARRVRDSAGEGVDGVVLAMDAQRASQFVNEVAKEGIPWFFSPRLKTDALLFNVVHHSLEGAVVLEPLLQAEDSAGFADAFTAAYGKASAPSPAVLFAFDTAALSLAALDRASRAGPLTTESFNAAMRELARPGGVLFSWNEVGQLLDYSQQHPGEKLQYSGLTGTIRFRDDGTRELSAATFYVIRDGQFVEDDAF